MSSSLTRKADIFFVVYATPAIHKLNIGESIYKFCHVVKEIKVVYYCDRD